MIKPVSIIILFLFMSGCSSTFPAFSKKVGSASHADQFSAALQQLELQDDPSELKKISESDPPSIWSKNAGSVLKIYATQQKKVSRLNNKNKELNEANAKLKNNIEKLNRINLEMEKRSP